MAHSEQLIRLLARYGVRTQRELLRAIRDEYTVETGERYTLLDAELMLDGMLEAEYQRIAGGAYEPHRESCYCLRLFSDHFAGDPGCQFNPDWTARD
jgi:hypothetical protein